MFGLLNINKPSGVTSRRVVDQVQRLVRPAKAGHAGTLDPLARGVLVVCLGRATRLIKYVQQMRKRYRGTFVLGYSSPTEDVDGEVTAMVAPPRPSGDEIIRATVPLVGRIEQRPPSYSALKVNGRRAYDLARSGMHVDLDPRLITVYSIEMVSYQYPRLVLDICCGSGTYIRSLGRDLAESLGTAAVLSELVRTAIGGFRIEDACSSDELTTENLSHYLLSPGVAVADLTRVELNPTEIKDIVCGRSINRPEINETVGEIAAFDTASSLVATLVPRGNKTWGPARCFDTRN